MWNEDNRIINVTWEYQESLPAQGQHDKSLKSYPSLPAQLDSHSDTQSGLETVLDLWVPSHLPVWASFWVLQWSEAEQNTQAILVQCLYMQTSVTEKKQMLPECNNITQIYRESELHIIL